MTEDLYLHRLYGNRSYASVIEHSFNLHGAIIRQENLTNFSQNSFPLVSLLLVHNISWFQVIIKNYDSAGIYNIKSSYFVSNGVHLVIKLFNFDDYKKLKQTLSGLFCTNLNTVNIVTKPVMISDDILYQYYFNPSICQDLYKSFIRLLPRNNKLNKYIEIRDPYALIINISLSTSSSIRSICDITYDNIIKLRFNYNANVTVFLDSSQDAKYSTDNILLQDIQNENSKEYASYIKNTNLTSHIYDSNINFKRHVYLYNYNEVNNLNITITEIIPNYYDLNFRGYYYCVIPLVGINYTLTKSTYTAENSSYCKVITNYQLTYHVENYDTFSSITWSTNIPSNSKIFISTSYRKLFMNFEQYPADAYKGFEVYPTVIYFKLHNNENFHFFTTESLLLSFPVGDFSMPFNVITLISTIFAFLVGSVVNTLVKKNINK